MKGFSGFGNSPMTKKSPAKDDPEATHPEHHETKEVVYNKDNPHPLMGELNDRSNRVIDETGNWAGVGDRSDLANPKQIQANKDKLAKIKVPGRSVPQ